jgi:hypothetical protein
MEILRVTTACLVWFGLAPPLLGATYHVDSQSGNDGNSGLSPLSAWRTINRANQPVYAPGDSILLKRGGSWQGTGFKANGNGDAQSPIILADYGDPNLPRPIIDGVGTHEPAVLLQNVQNWIVRNLELTQHGQTPQNPTPSISRTDRNPMYSGKETLASEVSIYGNGRPFSRVTDQGVTGVWPPS